MSDNQNGEFDGGNSIDLSLFNLLERVAQGDSLAENRMHEAYAGRLEELASRNISRGLQNRFDQEDVVQSVFRTFFRRNEKGEFQVSNSQELWKLLARITVLKTRSYARNQTAEKRTPKLEEADKEADLISDGLPDAETMVIVREEISAALVGLPDTAAEILSLRLSGHSKTEIGKLTNFSRQTVHKTLKLIYDRLQESFELSSQQ